MGERWIVFYRTRVKKSWKLAFFATFVTGLLVHLYKFTNTLPGHDSLFNIYSSQNMVKLGRWALAPACAISSFFDLPWIIGIISVFWIALTAVLIADIFRMENPVLIFLTGGLLSTFPAIAQTFYFEFTADGYLLAMALAALTVRLSLIGETRRSRLFLAFCCITVVCAIYQAYVCFALVLSLCYFMAELLENRYGKKQYPVWIRNQLLIYGLGMAAYYIIWQLILRLSGGPGPAPYMGIETIGKISLETLVSSVTHTISSFASVFLVWNFLERGMTVYTALNLLFLLMLFLTVIAAVRKSRLYQRKFHLLLFCLCAAALPFAVYIWFFVSPGVQYTVRMEQSVCVIYILAAVLLARWVSPKKSDLAVLLLAAIIFNNSVTSNVLYHFMDRCYEKSYATALEISTHIHLLDDGTIRQIAVLGKTDWFTEEEYESPSGLKELALLKSSVYNNLFSAGSVPELFLSQVAGLELSYYKEHPEEPVPTVDTGVTWPVPAGWEWKFPLVSEDVKARLIQSEEVREMGCWPAADSVKVIDGIAVIKLEELS